MRIAVIGAGVIGTTTAYMLARDGHEVTVFERNGAPAQGASFSNAGNLSPGAAAPWAAPQLPFQILRWMTGENAAVQFRLRADRDFLLWLAASLLQCRPSAYAANVAALKTLAAESMTAMADLRRAVDVPFDHQALGSLRLFADAADFAKVASAFAANDVLSASECYEREPGLRQTNIPVAGGIFLRNDESGDCQAFTRGLAAKSEALGITFRYGVTISALRKAGDVVTGVVAEQGTEPVDAVVLCAGAWSPALTRPLGIRLAVIPIKGYALTVNIAEPDRAPRAAVMFDARKISVTRLGNRIRAAGIADFDGFNPQVRQSQIDKLRRCVDDLFPRAADWTTVQTWAGFRPATPSGLPFIGRSAIRNLVLNTGHGPLGWTLAAGSASRVAALLA
jgi:D-amino-acid dehydrogenase